MEDSPICFVTPAFNTSGALMFRPSLLRPTAMVLVGLTASWALAACSDQRSVNAPATNSAAPVSVGATQKLITSGDDARTAELVVNSYFDDIYTHQLKKAESLFYVQNAGDPNRMYTETPLIALNKAKLTNYSVSGSEYDVNSEYTIVRVHYKTQGDSTEKTANFDTQEDKLESRWEIAGYRSDSDD